MTTNAQREALQIRDLLDDKIATAKSLAAQAEQADLDLETHDSLPDLIQTLRMLTETAESALRTAVAYGRGCGMTWDEIGKWLCVSRQAAQQRFGG